MPGIELMRCVRAAAGLGIPQFVMVLCNAQVVPTDAAAVRCALLLCALPVPRPVLR